MFIDTKKQSNLNEIFLNLQKKGIICPELFTIIETIPREVFVPLRLQNYSYKNGLIPIECGSYIERLEDQIRILSALDIKKDHKVLEIGTGSGYSSALMACLAARVTTVERYTYLAKRAFARYQELGIMNIISEIDDAKAFIKKPFTYDRILIWPALQEEPRAFLELLPHGGKMIAAIGAGHFLQEVTLYQRKEDILKKQTISFSRYQPLLKMMN